ncbi:MAG: SdrD B-like domain-containing protein [Saprospiraceae bacterium]|nr:SdrD B-like domain-containing protein [Saprospiraceae bacterium]
MQRLFKFKAILIGLFAFASLFTNSAIAQVTMVDYQAKYNTDNCLWDFYIIIQEGTATTVPQRAQFNSQYSIVVPTGTVISGVPVNYMPLQNNQSYTGTVPLKWTLGTPVINPPASPGNDFYGITPTLSPASFYNNLAPGDTVKIFALDIGPITECGEGIRLFDNDTDPASNEPGMGGGDFSNGFTIGGSNQTYNTNAPKVPPPPPVISASNTCAGDLVIDLDAVTSVCQEPMTYEWTGPNGYVGTDEDVNILNATDLNNGTYFVTVTDAFGCSSELSIEGEVKPDAGIDMEGCPDGSVNLQGSNPTTGTWTADATNPSGATLVPGSGGAATVNFDATALGSYNYIYTNLLCSDTMTIDIILPDAGSPPSPLSCFSSGTASINADGSQAGVWSVDPSSAGTATINDPNSASTFVTGFSDPGDYILVWTVGACSDQITISTSDMCGCAIANNILQTIDPNVYCGSSGVVSIDGNAATPSGSYLWEYRFDGGAFAAAAGTNTTEDYSTIDLPLGNHEFRRIYTTDSGVICSDTSNIVGFDVFDNPPAPSDLVASPSTVCVFETTNLSVTNNPSATYTWTASSPDAGLGSSTTNTVSMTPTAPGTYTISVTQTVNGCESPPATTDVTVIDAPPTPTDPSVSSTDPTTCGANDGTISLSGYNPSETYTVLYSVNGAPTSINITANGSGVLEFISLAPAAYTNFQIVSSIGCISGVYPGPVTLTDPSAPPTPEGIMADPNPECLGEPITISVDPFPGATFNWSASSPNAGLGTSTTNVITMNATVAGFYIITVNQTVAGCTSPDTTISVAVNDSPPTPTGATVAGTNPSVCGGMDGFITLSGYLNSTSYDITYAKNGVDTTYAVTTNSSGIITIPNLSEGTYTNFTVTNNTGCSSGEYPGPVSLSDPGSPPAPSGLVALPNPVCLGNSVTLSVDNTPGATFNWSASSPDAGLGSSSSNFITMDATVAGTYTINVSVTIAGCTSPSTSIDVVVGDTAPTPSSITPTDPTSCSGSEGTLSISGYMAGATYGVDYEFEGSPVSVSVTADGSGNLIITGLSSGSYTNFQVTNSANCPSNVFGGPVVLNEPNDPPAPTGIAADPNPICQGESMTISVDDVPGATYTWSVSPSDGGFGTSTTNTISFTPQNSGVFVVSVFLTLNNCTSPPSNINAIVEPSPDTPIAADISSTNPSFCTGSDGTISISNLDPSVSYGIQYDSAMIVINDVITANASGVLTITGLAAGSYSNIILTNSSGCSSGAFTGPVILSDPGAPNAPENLTAIPNPVCLGNTVDLSVTNNPSAEYTWSTPNPDAGLGVSTTNTNTMNPTSAGIYTVFVTQSIAGCTSPPAMIDVVVSDIPPTPDGTSVIGVDPSDCGLSNGTITISGLIPSTTYTLAYSIDGVPTSGSFTTNPAGEIILTDLGAGDYSDFSLVNGQGCSSGIYPGPVTLVEPAAPGAPTAVGTDPSDCGVDNGSILVGGLSPSTSNTLSYTYNGSVVTGTFTTNASGEINLTGLAAGSYTNFSYVNQAGCTSEVFAGPVVLSEPNAPSAPTAIGTDPTDCGVDNGSILVGGLSPLTSNTLTYTYNGSVVTGTFTTNAAGEINLTGLAIGNYTNFSYINPVGCSSDVFPGPITLSEPNAPAAPTGLFADPNPICLGGTVDLGVDFVSGATYTWSASSPDAGLILSTTETTTMTASAAGTYTISVYLTIAGCSSSPVAIDVVINPLPPTPSAGVVSFTDPTACALDDGTITISGYNPGQSYALNYAFNGVPDVANLTANPTGDLELLFLLAGTYSDFSVEDGNGCSSGTYAGPVVLSDPGSPPPPDNLTATPNPICVGGTVQLSVDFTAGATYNWTISPSGLSLNSNGNNTNSFVASNSGLYTVSVFQTIADCVSPPVTIDVLILEDCVNPDFGVTYADIQLTGLLGTNDYNNGVSSYGNVVASLGNPDNCMPVVASDGSYTFDCSTPGEYEYTVEVCKAGQSVGCIAVPLVITVLDIMSTENPPIANHDYIATTANNSVTIEILSNDKCQSIPSCILTNLMIVASPSNGAFNPATLEYSPNIGFIGRDSFRYEVCQDPFTPQSCDQEWVYIDIYPSVSTDFTNAMDDYNQTSLNATLEVDASEGVLSNDTDPLNSSVDVTFPTVTVPGKGSITWSSDGSYTFIPETGFIGPVDFEYQVCRQNNGSICAAATLHLLVEPQAAAGTVGSCVWEDLNANGVLESGEPSIGGVEVNMYTSAGVLYASTTTDIDGFYQFDDVPLDDYFIEFIAPEDLEFTFPNVGDEATDSDVDDSNGPGTTATFTVNAGEFVDYIKAGFYRCIKIGENVWYDVNEDDTYDDNENGINGLKVYLWRLNNGVWEVWDETTTGKKPNSPSDDGWYQFCAPPGTYYIEIILPPTGLVQVIPFVGNNKFRDSDINNGNGPGTTNTFTVSNGIDKLDIGAGYYPMAEAGNLVWHDENFDGIQNQGEAKVADVLVEVYDVASDKLLAQDVTDEDGIYHIDYLEKMDVYFKFTPPAEMVATIPDTGNDEIDSDVDHTYGPNTTRKVSMDPGIFNEHIDFGVAFGALPVSWVDITVKDINNAHMVQWEVEQEIDVAYYEVQRSLNDFSNFTTISKEKISANNVVSTSRYDFIDQDELIGGTYYYRIKQYDVDGKFNFSPRVSIKRESRLETRIYPNPSSTMTNIQFVAENDGELSIKLIDVSGKVVLSTTKTVDEGEGNIRLDLADLPEGVYNMSIELNNTISTKRLIKIK